MNCFSTREGGFSLVELMVAVGIIGVMSSVAVPKYQKFRANAAQSEAQATLSSIYTLQQLFYTENDRYAKLDTTDDDNDELGFSPSGSARYTYTGGLLTRSNGVPKTDLSDAVKFRAVADSETALASCADKDKDIWCVNEDKHLSNKKASGETCKTEATHFQDGGCTGSTTTTSDADDGDDGT